MCWWRTENIQKIYKWHYEVPKDLSHCMLKKFRCLPTCIFKKKHSEFKKGRLTVIEVYFPGPDGDWKWILVRVRFINYTVFRAIFHMPIFHHCSPAKFFLWSEEGECDKWIKTPVKTYMCPARTVLSSQRYVAIRVKFAVNYARGVFGSIDDLSAEH